MLQFNHVRFMVAQLVHHETPFLRLQAELAESIALINTYGGEVIVQASQNAVRGDAGTYIGKGKARELAIRCRQEHIDVVVINETITSSQLFSLKLIFEAEHPLVQVWDRTDLILEIFRKHAVSAEAKLQIKLASVQHQGPELHGMGKLMSQQGAGIGTRGMGETNTEIMRRHWRSEIKHIEADIQKVRSSRNQQMGRRKKTGLPTLSIIGYTNAGKTTLFNLLTKKNNVVRNAPFVTLDSSVGMCYLPRLGHEAYVTDTIGFIENLPTTLIEAFQSTLMETVHADLLLTVIDSSDPLAAEKIRVVQEILKTLDIGDKKQLFVLNKVDIAPADVVNDLIRHYADFTPQKLAAQQGDGLETLVETIQNILEPVA